MKIKRVIEIDESLYNRIQERMTTLSDIPCLFGLVADSKPYNPTGDTISREAFRKHYCKINCGERQCVDHADRCFFIDELMQFKSEPERPQGEWISVKDRLPEKLETVLAYDNNDVFVAWYDEGWKSSDSQFDKNTPIVKWLPIHKESEAEND